MAQAGLLRDVGAQAGLTEEQLEANREAILGWLAGVGSNVNISAHDRRCAELFGCALLYRQLLCVNAAYGWSIATNCGSNGQVPLKLKLHEGQPHELPFAVEKRSLQSLLWDAFCIQTCAVEGLQACLAAAWIHLRSCVAV
jgi:hypothetical protein